MNKQNYDSGAGRRGGRRGGGGYGGDSGGRSSSSRPDYSSANPMYNNNGNNYSQQPFQQQQQMPYGAGLVMPHQTQNFPQQPQFSMSYPGAIDYQTGLAQQQQPAHGQYPMQATAPAQLYGMPQQQIPPAVHEFQQFNQPQFQQPYQIPGAQPQGYGLMAQPITSAYPSAMPPQQQYGSNMSGQGFQPQQSGGYSYRGEQSYGSDRPRRRSPSRERHDDRRGFGPDRKRHRQDFRSTPYPSGHSQHHDSASSSAQSSSGGGGSREVPCRTLFVRNVPYNTPETRLKEMFGAFGDVKSIFNLLEKRGLVFITYFDIRSAESARKQMNGTDLDGRKIDVHFSLPKAEDMESRICDSEKNQGTILLTLKDGKIPLENQALTDMFSQYGELKVVRDFKTHPNQRFVEFWDSRHCRAAVDACNNMEYNGGRLDLRFAWDAPLKIRTELPKGPRDERREQSYADGRDRDQSFHEGRFRERKDEDRNAYIPSPVTVPTPPAVFVQPPNSWTNPANAPLNQQAQQAQMLLASLSAQVSATQPSQPPMPIAAQPVYAAAPQPSVVPSPAPSTAQNLETLAQMNQLLQILQQTTPNMPPATVSGTPNLSLNLPVSVPHASSVSSPASITSATSVSKQQSAENGGKSMRDPRLKSKQAQSPSTATLPSKPASPQRSSDKNVEAPSSIQEPESASETKVSTDEKKNSDEFSLDRVTEIANMLLQQAPDSTD